MARYAIVLVLLALGCARAAPSKSAPPASQPAAEPESGAPGDDAAPAPEPVMAPAPSEAESVGDEDSRQESSISSGALAKAEADLDRARAELDSALGGGRFAEPPPAAPPATAPSRELKPSDRASGAAPKARAEKKKDEDPCVTVCRAFSSLARSAAAVCRLDGDDGDRCARARSVVSSAEARVQSCGCRRP